MNEERLMELLTFANDAIRRGADVARADARLAEETGGQFATVRALGQYLRESRDARQAGRAQDRADRASRRAGVDPTRRNEAINPTSGRDPRFSPATFAENEDAHHAAEDENALQ